MWGGLAGSATGGALGGSIVNSHDDRKTSVSHYLGVEPIGSINHEDKINPTRTSITKESSMSTPFTDYMQIKTAAPWSYYSPFMVPAAVGAATGAMQAGPDRRMLGATLGGGAGLVGGHFGGVAGKAIGGVENAALAPKLREIASARALEAEKAYNEAVRAARSKPSVEAKDLVKSNLEHYNKMLDMSRSSDPIKGFSDYPAMLGQLGGSAAGGYLGGSVAGIGNDRR
jgi:hypothetical protein